MFDKSAKYSKEIEPLIVQLKAACNLYQIPFFVSCAVFDDGEKTTYKSDMISAYGNGIQLAQDMFPKFANVLNGFETVLPSSEPELELSERQIEAPELGDPNLTSHEME